MGPIGGRSSNPRRAARRRALGKARCRVGAVDVPKTRAKKSFLARGGFRLEIPNLGIRACAQACDPAPADMSAEAHVRWRAASAAIVSICVIRESAARLRCRAPERGQYRAILNCLRDRRSERASAEDPPARIGCAGGSRALENARSRRSLRRTLILTLRSSGPAPATPALSASLRDGGVPRLSNSGCNSDRLLAGPPPFGNRAPGAFLRCLRVVDSAATPRI